VVISADRCSGLLEFKSQRNHITIQVIVRTQSEGFEDQASTCAPTNCPGNGDYIAYAMRNCRNFSRTQSNSPSKPTIEGSLIIRRN